MADIPTPHENSRVFILKNVMVENEHSSRIKARFLFREAAG
jgi:hypothetical protein